MAKSDGGEHAGHRQRMRNRYLKNGFDGFSEHEILEMLLFYSIKRRNTNDLAHEIIKKYGTLANVFEAEPENLMKEMKISDVTASLLTMIPGLLRAYEVSKLRRLKYLKNTEEIGAYAVAMLKDKRYEEFGIICLNASRHLIWSGIIIKGTIDQTEAYPRIVVNEALKHGATKVVLAHNHPSGNLTPSVADKEATDVLTKLLNGIGIEVLDHIIVGGTRYFSMKEAGFKF